VRLLIAGPTSSPEYRISGAHPRVEGCLMTAERDQYGEIVWRKSSVSDAGNGCVEVGVQGPFVLVRDSRNSQGGMLKVTSERWREFLRLIGDANVRRSAEAPPGQ
jgi:hypothetical protein